MKVNRDKEMKKIIKILPVTAAILLLSIIISAEEINDGFLLLTEKYTENSPSYNTIELQYEKSKTDDYLNEYRLKSAETGIEDNRKQIEALEQQLSNETDYYEKQSLLANIEYRKIYAFELELNKAELELESAFNGISEEFSEITLKIEKKKSEYKLRNQLNTLTALKKQLSYLELQKQYCTENVDITKSSLKIGYATQHDVENAKSQLSKAKASIAECEMQIVKNEKEIELNSGEAMQEYAYDYIAKCDISEVELIEQFKEASPQEEILEKQAQAYRELVEKAEKIKKRLIEYIPKESESNKNYKERLFRYVEGAMTYYNNELRIVENNIKSYEISLELYVSELIGKRGVCFAQIEAAEAELKAAETNINVMNAFYAEGHVRPIDMTEAYAKQAKAEYELISVQISLDSVIFAIENNVILN